MQRVKDVLQSVFHLDICCFLTLSQLVCVNLALYHTQLLFILYPLTLPLGQPVPACGERTVGALGYIYSSCISLGLFPLFTP